VGTQAFQTGAAIVDASPIELNPQGLDIGAAEREFVAQLGPLLSRSPRVLKRFVNTYRLMRVRVAPESLGAFEGTAEAPGESLAAMLLLAVICGFPNLAPDFLVRLHEAAVAKKSWDELRQSVTAEWPELGKAFGQLDSKAVLSDLTAYDDWIERAARYSFSASLAAGMPAAGE